jgi:zinc protease
MPMPRGLLALVLLLSFAAAARAERLPAGQDASGPFLWPVHTRTLENGLRVAVVRTQSPGMFSLREIVGVGSRDEVEDGHSGFAHFFEHMMFRGTPRFSSEARGELLVGLGVNESGSTTDDFTIYSFVGPAGALPEILELEADRHMNLAYSEADFRTEAQAVLGEYNKSFSSPDMLAWQELRGLSFTKHTYAHTVIGFLEDIRQMPERYDYSRQFFKRFYTPDNTLLIVVGDVEPEQVFALVDEHFRSWQGTRAKVLVPKEPEPTKARDKRVSWPSPTRPRVHVAWRIPATGDAKASATARLLGAYLFSEASSLYKALVLDEQKIEGLSSWWRPNKDPSLFPVNWRLKEGAEHEEVLARVQTAVDKVAAGKIDEARFEAVKSHLRYAALMDLASADQVASALGWASGIDLDATKLDATLVALAALRPEELAAFARAGFSERRRSVVVVEPPASGGER